MPRLSPRPAKLDEPSGDPLRQALADAISVLREAKEIALASHATAKRAGDHVTAAQARLDQANETVEAAMARLVFLRVTAAQDDLDAPADKGLRTARNEAALAADDLAAAEKAFDTLQEACDEPDELVALAQRGVDDAVDALLAGRAGDILSEAEALASSLANRISILQFLGEVLERCAAARRHAIISSSADTAQAVAIMNSEPDDATAQAIKRFIATHASPDHSDWRSDPHLADWFRVSDALKHDHAVALPS
ncbi:MAG TPA: hypothetical protein VG328_07345 [Stellaceae bacterium]|nr:hypothetical protein [Stellaceae bacterium]